MKKLFAILMLSFAATAVVQAQTIAVHGKVIDKGFNEPMVGVAVIVDATGAGDTTNVDGEFTLNNVPQSSMLTFSYLGYKEVKAAASAEMTIYLEEDTEVMDEVVVVGYSVQRKADLTGSVSVVNTKDIMTAASTDPMRALQGKVAGMTVTTDGSPSGTGVVRIRGIGSFNSDQNPLYVIDGVPTTTGLNTLNMNDIESMQVLKDAASASIYGSRAANGVIIITTKQGKKGEGKVNIDFSAGWTAQFYNSQSKMSLLNTQGYATAMAQAALNDGIDPVAYASNYGLDLNAPAGLPIRAYNPATGSYVDYMVNGRYDGYINAARTMRASNTDWLKAISRTGFMHNYDVSLSRANENSSSLFSLGYKQSDGIMKYTDFDVISARMNNSFNLGKYVTVGENFTMTYSTQLENGAPMENALKMAPIVPVYEEDGVTFSGPVGSMSDRQNPLRELYHNKDNRRKLWRMFGNAYIDIKPFKGFVFRSNFGLDFDSAFWHNLTHTFHSDIVNNDTNASYVAHAYDSKYTWSNTINYDFSIGEQHSFHILAGTEIFRQTRVDIRGYNEGYAIEDPNYMWPDASTGIERSEGNQSAYALASFFGKIDYNWNDLLLASFTIRYDGSSRFGRNNRYGTFPSATLGYRLSKHIDRNWLDDLKLRLAWGQTGNQAISNTARYALFAADYGSDRVTSTAYDLWLQGSGIFGSGYRALQSENPNLKWETAIQYNVGLDFAFLRNRLTGTVDAYIKDVKDMLINPAYLGSMGEGGAAWANGPSLRNSGMEFTIGWRDQLPSGFSYGVNTNFDFFRNRVTYLPSTTTGSYAHTTTENLVESRRPYGSIVGYVADGLFKSQEEVLTYGQDNARVGGIRYADLNGDGRITAEDQTWIFSPVPDLSMGLNVELSYKNFDFAMFWQGVFGQDVYNDQKFQTDFWSITDAGSNKGTRLLEAWTPANSKSTIPALTTNNTSDEGRTSTYYVENGSYAKLRTLQLGYNLPRKWMDKAHMRSARVYLSGNNLLTIKSRSLTCSDPENPRWAYPTSTSVTFGIQIGF